MEFAFLLSFQRHTKNELLIINQSNTGRPYFWLRDFIHEFSSDFKIVENNWLINSTFRNWPKLDDDFSDDTEISLMAKNEFMNIRTWTNSWWFLMSLEGTNWCSNFYSYNYVINIAISIFFHSWSSCTDPTSKGWELNWIWFMTTTNSKLWEFFFHIFSDNSSFDASHHIVFINPFNFIHSCTVYRNNCSFLTLLAHQAFSNICSSE